MSETPINDRLVAYIRTYTPVVIGALLTIIVVKLPNVSATLTAIFGDWQSPVIAAATAILTSLYYFAVRQLSKKWPVLEKLLGSSLTPTYSEDTTSETSATSEASTEEESK